VNIFLIIVIKVEKEFLNKILNILPKDPYSRKIYN